MKKRLIALMILAAMLLAALPVSAAELNTPVEDFTVEQTDSGFTVILPDGYAERGFFKLFWKNNLTDETLNAVFPVDTTAYQIETEAGAEYSFQLFYAKKRGLLPAGWKEEKAEEEFQGPSIWKVLWIDVETVDCLGITNRMTERNHQVSEEVSKAFESFVEESTDGLVDIEITRMTIDEPVTALTYNPDYGYSLPSSELDVKHLALRKYDSVLVMARLDHFALTYAGLATAPENPREEPGYAVVVMLGDNPSPEHIADMKIVCVHEWIHQLGSFYQKWQLEIPNPDKPEVYGFDPYTGNRDMQFFKEVLTMKAQADDGRLLGVPAEAWQYKPTHNPEKWNLSYLQDQEVPADFQPREKQPVITPELPEGPDIFDIPTNGIIYENATMDIGCALEDWVFYTQQGYLNLLDTNRARAGEYSDEDPDFLKNNDPVTMMYMANSKKPGTVTFQVSTSAVPFVKQYGEEAYAEEIKKFYDRAFAASSPDDFSYEIIHRRISDREVPGIKISYNANGTFEVYTEMLYWLNGDLLNTLIIKTSMTDYCTSILNHIYLLSSPYHYSLNP